eukprot:7106889-Pyramimonas_sp.AAC.1
MRPNGLTSPLASSSASSSSCLVDEGRVALEDAHGVRLRVEDPLVHGDVARVVEEQVEVLERLRQEEALHGVVLHRARLPHIPQASVPVLQCARQTNKPTITKVQEESLTKPNMGSGEDTDSESQV